MQRTNLSNEEAVKRLAHSLLGLIFEGGGFEEMIASSGLGMFAGAAKPIVKRKALESISSLGPAQADWLIEQVHALSFQFEELTGNFSPFHYESEADR